MSDDTMTDEDRPDGVSEFDHKKLPFKRAVVKPGETVQSIWRASR